MGRLRSTVKESIAARDEIESLRHQLESLEEIQKKRLREHIPDLMAEMGLTEVTVDGFNVTLRSDLQISMISIKAIDWLDENGFGGLVKTKIEVSYARDERETAIQIKKMLEERGATVELKENVHWQTLKAWGRERVANGETLPSEHFDVMAFTEAKLKQLPAKAG